MFQRRASFEALEPRRMLADPHVTFFSNPISIPDNGVRQTSFELTSDDMVEDVDLAISVNHDRISDIEVFLIGPDGTRVEMFRRLGGNSADFNGILDDDAIIPVEQGETPFRGRFQPSGSLSDFDGVTVAGEWTVEVVDVRPGFSGNFVFELYLNAGPADLALNHVLLVDDENDPVEAFSPGDTIRLRAEWTATGLFFARYHVRFQVNGVPIDSANIQAGFNHAGNHFWWLGGWKATPGEHLIEVTVDADGRALEVDETNNTHSFTIVVAGPEPLTDPFAVNDFTLRSDLRARPLLAMSPGGQFAIGGLPDPFELDWQIQHYDDEAAAVNNVYTTGVGANIEDDAALLDNGQLLTAGSLRATQNKKVVARRFNASGSQLGDTVDVSELGSFGIEHTAIAQLPDGRYVVAWEGNMVPPIVPDPNLVLDEDAEGIYARIFDAADQPRGPSILVNTTTVSRQRNPDIAIAPNGDFLVVWESKDPDAEFETWVAKGQRFDSLGNPVGNEFTLGGGAANQAERLNPTAAFDAAGNFVIAWVANNSQLLVQRFNSNGTPMGGPWQIDNGLNNFGAPSLAVHSSGAFVVAWARTSRVLAQAYRADGSLDGATFEVTFDQGSFTPRLSPQVAMSLEGDFVIAWGEGGSADWRVFARLYQWRPGEEGGPTASIDEVTPDPREQPVESLNVRFSEAVEGFDVHDLRLTRDGFETLALEPEMLSSSDGGQTWTLALPAELTEDVGRYSLSLVADGAGITSTDGRDLVNSAVESWRQGNMAGPETPAILHVLTHGYNPNPFDFASFREPWLTEYPNALNDVSNSRGLDSTVYTTTWNSSLGFHTALLATVYEYLGLLSNEEAAQIQDIGTRLSRRMARSAAQNAVDDLLAAGLLGAPEDAPYIHLVGHSRGAAVNAQISALLTDLNYTVDQYTALDGFSTEWPSPANILGDLSIGQTAQSGCKVSYLVEDSLAAAAGRFIGDTLEPFYEFFLQLPIPDGIFGDVGASLGGLLGDWRMIDLTSSGFLSPTLVAPAGGDPSNHLNIHEYYFAPDSQYILDIPTQSPCSAPPPGEGEPGDHQPVVAPTLSDVDDGSFEQLGEILRDGLLLGDPADQTDPLVRYMQMLRQHPSALLQTSWNTSGDVQLVIDGANTLVEMTADAEASTLGQFVELSQTADELWFDVDVLSASGDDVLEVWFDDAMLLSLPLAGQQGPHSLELDVSELAGRFGDLTFQLIRVGAAPATIRLDNINVRSIGEVDLFTVAPAPLKPPGNVQLAAENIVDPPGGAQQVRFYREQNGVPGLQSTADQLLGADDSGADGWSFAASAAGMPYGWNLFYAVADHGQGEGPIASASLTIEKPAFPYHNLPNPADVDLDGIIAPADALAIINEILRDGSRPLEDTDFVPSHMLDTDADNFIAPGDALRVVNALLMPGPPPAAEGEFVFLLGDVAPLPIAPESQIVDQFFTPQPGSPRLLRVDELASRQTRPTLPPRDLRAATAQYPREERLFEESLLDELALDIAAQFTQDKLFCPF